MDPFIGEIRLVGFNFAPSGWALCNGQLIPIAQNTGLFAILGTTYGGDGKTTFALPNLQGRIAMHPGQGPGLTPHTLGECGGSATVTLQSNQMPAHNHTLKGTPLVGTGNSPANTALAKPASNIMLYAAASAISGELDPQAMGVTGGSQPHNNQQPYLVLNYIIALQGYFPPRY